MTVTTTTNTVVYRGNGAATTFAVPFLVLDEDHLVVKRRVFATQEIEATYIGTDYSYSGIGDPAGTLTLAGTALSSTYELIITREVPYRQDLDIVNAGGFYPDTVENQLDLLEMQIQQVSDKANRAVRAPVGNDQDDVELIPGEYFVVGGDGQVIGSSGTGADAGLRTDLAASDGATLVNVTQSGTGMGTRTLYAKAREALSLGDALPAADGTTDDTTKFDNVIAEAEARGGAEIFIPPGDYAYTSINIPTGVYPKGPFSGQAFGAKLICTATSGPAITITERACGLENLWLSCSDDRWNTGTPTTAHMISITAGDIASPSAISQLRLANLQIDRSPRDGVHGVGTMELSLFENVHVRGAKRHGFAFDDGSRDSYVNIANALFMTRFVRCRAIDCGGNAGAFGRVGMANPCRHVILDQFEALGCGWDSAVREVTQQVLLRGDGFWVLLPDIEDQQYANSTISGTGDAKTNRGPSGDSTGPSGGIYLLGSGKVWGGHWSSLAGNYVNVAGGSSFVEIDLTSAKFFTGTYATAIAVAVVIGGNVKGSLRLKTDAAITKVATVQSAGMDAWKDGIPYRTTTASGYDVGISLDPTPTEVVIASGIATLAATSVKLRGEGAAADDCQTLIPLAGQVFPEGLTLRTHRGGEDITFLIANDFITRTNPAANVSITSAWPIRSWCSNGTKLMEQ